MIGLEQLPPIVLRAALVKERVRFAVGDAVRCYYLAGWVPAVVTALVVDKLRPSAVRYVVELDGDGRLANVPSTEVKKRKGTATPTK